MEIVYGAPLRGRQAERVKMFLRSLGLGWEKNVHSTVLLEENGEIVAAGSREYNVLKCIGVSPAKQGEGLAATLLTELTKDALHAGFRHLFIYTDPKNSRIFRELGFYEVARTADALLLENERNGVSAFVETVRRPHAGGVTGAIVANCNPFTNGHKYLVEQAAAQCDFLYLFILSERRSRFPAEIRLQLAMSGTEHIANVAVVPTGDYLVSSATFPDYFLKDKARSAEVNCDMDVAAFAERFAKPLGITKRFVGTEPFCAVTRCYNERMKAVLPCCGVEIIEMPRYETCGGAISASRVRALWDSGQLEELRPLVPTATWKYLKGVRPE